MPDVQDSHYRYATYLFVNKNLATWPQSIYVVEKPRKKPHKDCIVASPVLLFLGIALPGRVRLSPEVSFSAV